MKTGKFTATAENTDLVNTNATITIPLADTSKPKSSGRKSKGGSAVEENPKERVAKPTTFQSKECVICAAYNASRLFTDTRCLCACIALSEKRASYVERSRSAQQKAVQMKRQRA